MELKKRNTKGVTGLKSFESNKENPFVKDTIEQISNHIVKKYKTASNTEESAVLQAVDPKTGELLGHTQFIRQIELDDDKFAKVYLAQFSAFFDLKPQALRVFGYILNQLVPHKDELIFYLEDCQEYTGYKSDTSVRIGLTSLLENGIIARGRTEFTYFINPMIAFNGNRVTFARTYVKKRKDKEDPNQQKINFSLE